MLSPRFWGPPLISPPPGATVCCDFLPTDFVIFTGTAPLGWFRGRYMA